MIERSIGRIIGRPRVKAAKGLLRRVVPLGLLGLPFLPLRQRAIRSYLASQHVRKLQLGAGRAALPGWLNTDILPGLRSIVLDARKPFPFQDQTFDYVLSEHQIEHIDYLDGVHMLCECFRVLKPNGRIRVATPDLTAILGLHSEDKGDIQSRYIQWSVDTHLPQMKNYNASIVINNFFYSWGHRFIYDRQTLQTALESTGFVDVTRYEPGESNDAHLAGIESHGKYIGEEMNRFETMVLEARRPA